MRGYLISIWSLIDPFYYFCTSLTYLPSKDKEGNVFRIRLTKYKRSNIVLSDGTQINKNDTLVKIHLHNVKLLKELKDIKSEFKKATIIYHYVKKSLPGVEIYIRNSCRSDKIKGNRYFLTFPRKTTGTLTRPRLFQKILLSRFLHISYLRGNFICIYKGRR